MRVRLGKGPEARYISHLDLKRTLERALRRAGLQVAFSAGYNPNMRISFASALAVGVTSEGELLDILLSEPVTPGEFVARLNAQLPPGLAVLAARGMDAAGGMNGGGPSLAEAVEWAGYRLDVGSPSRAGWAPSRAGGSPPPDWRGLVDEFLQRDSIVVERVSHEGEVRRVDVRPLVHRVAVEVAAGPEARLHAVFRAGSRRNLRPDEFVTALGMLRGGVSVELRAAHRLELMAGGETGPVPLEDTAVRKE